MRTNENLQEILNTLEKVRSSQYPDIYPEILAQIVDIQYNNQEPDRRSNAKVDTAKAVRQYIEQKL